MFCTWSRQRTLLTVLIALWIPSQSYGARCVVDAGEAAIPACEAELQRTPESVPAMVRYANVLMKLERHQEAAKLLSNGLEIHPGNRLLEKHYRLASGRGQSAAKLNEMIRKADQLVEDDKIKEALAIYNRALRESPNNKTLKSKLISAERKALKLNVPVESADSEAGNTKRYSNALLEEGRSY